MNVYDFFAESARRTPDATALSDARGALTYRQVGLEVEDLAQSLFAAGVREGGRVALLAPNCSAALIGALAVFRLGAVWLPVNTRNSVLQNVEYLTRCDVRTLLYHPAMEDLAERLQSAVGRSWERVRTDARATATQPLPDRRSAPDAITCMLSTGGTTGSPKAVLWTESVLQAMVASFWLHIPCDEPATYLAATPLTHAAGVIAFCMLARGAHVIIHEGFHAGEFLACIQERHVTHVFLPPTAIYGLLAVPGVERHDFASLRAFIYSAAPMAAEKIREAVRVFGPVMVQLYGQAEVPLMCTILTAREHEDILLNGPEQRLQSCGRSTLLLQLEIMRPDGTLAGVGQTGEVVVRGALVMAGYYGHSEESYQAGLHGWHHTGDIGYKDEHGYVFIVDRLKDMIISGGFNVFSSEVEQVVLRHPAVQDCAVVGRPDVKWGEAVTAVLQLKPGAHIDLDELRALCRDQLGAVKAPKHFELWPDLPRSSVGKVLKRAVREHFWKGETRKI